MAVHYWEVTANSYEGEFPTGRTDPVRCRCTGYQRELGSVAGAHDLQSDLFVVKMCDGKEMTTEGRLCEFIAGLLAQCLGVAVVTPAIVTIPEGLAGFFPESKRRIVAAGCDLQFGSRFLPSQVSYPTEKMIEGRMFGAACSIFAFDMLSQNPDRRVSKPNLFTDGETLTVYDHELAFRFDVPIIGGGNDLPWYISPGIATDHVLYNGLRGKKPETDGFISGLRSLDESALQTICGSIPAGWSSDNIGKIMAHIRSVRDNADKFACEIERVLK